MTSETADEARASTARDPFDAALEELEPYPVHRDIYGEVDTGLANNLHNYGQQVPVKIDPERRVLSGNRRVKAARELGWNTIEAQEVDIESENEARRFILVANAYRAEKRWVVRYREAVEYRELVWAGELERSELAEIAENQDEDVAGETEPQLLAAKAAGMGPSSFHNLKSVLEPDGLEAKISHAMEENYITEEQAGDLQKRLNRCRTGIRQHDRSPNTAADGMRETLEEARNEHQMGEEARREKEWLDKAGTAEEQSTQLRKDIEELVDQAEQLGLEDTSVLDSVEEDLRYALDVLAELNDRDEEDDLLDVQEAAQSMSWER